MNRIKILHVIPSLVIGGAEKVLYDICRHMDFSRFNVTVVSLLRAKQGFETEFQNLKSIDKYINLAYNNRHDVRILFSLLNVFKRCRPDIIHTHLPVASIYSRICNLLTSKPLITSMHSILYKQNVFHSFDRLSSRWSDYFIANSESTRSYLIKNGYSPDEKIVTIPLGIDFTEYKRESNFRNEILYKNKIPEHAFIIGHIGSFKIQKGHFYLLQAFKLISEQIKNAYLILVGDGPLFSKIKDYAKYLEIESRIIFSGSTKNISSLLSAFDLMIFPSISESFGLSIVEAMYFGIPIIAFKTDAIPEIITHEDTGYLVEKGNINKLAEYTLYLYKNPEFRNHMAFRASNYIKSNYSIHKTVNRLGEFYEKVSGSIYC